MAKKGDEKKSKDPWHRENIEATLETRGEHHRNLLNVVQAMDSQLIFEVTKVLKEHSGAGIADWSLLDSESKKYNKDVADKVSKKIDEVYSLDSKLHPLAGIIKRADLENNYFNNRLVQGLYFGHVDKLKREIGSKDYLASMKHHHKENLEKVTESSMEHFFADVDYKKHGEGVVDFLSDRYNLDKKRIHTERMERDAPGLLQAHLANHINPEGIYRSYKPPKKKESEK